MNSQPPLEPTGPPIPAQEPLDSGKTGPFKLDSGTPLPVGVSVLEALAPGMYDPGRRYLIECEIARGGMGAVLKGRDTDLGREIAVKVLLETHAGKTELVQRFVEEARIAGQLQHPGVAPVYELGRFVDQRPYFTIKLVQGQTLAALLGARSDPAQDRPTTSR